MAKKLKAGQIVGLVGDLGTGKTTAIQAILSAFRLTGGESPTFVMIRQYDLPRPQKKIKSLIHIDAYRIDSVHNALTTGITDVLSKRRAIIMIEWAERLQSFLPEKTIWVHLRHRGGNKRLIEVTWP